MSAIGLSKSSSVLDTDCQSSGWVSFLPWDSKFFGRRIARITAPDLTEEKWTEVLKWCRKERIECVYFLVDSTELRSIQMAEQNGFQLMDIRMTLERNLDEDITLDSREPRSVQIRPPHLEDIPQLRKLAGMVYSQTRFFNDSHFPREHARALYETWIDQNCRNRNEKVLVAETLGNVVGFASGGTIPDDIGQIQLIGVTALARNKGAGQMLMAGLLGWFKQIGMKKSWVVTSGNNAPAYHFYQDSGFLVHKVQIWYHKWFSS